MALQLQVKCIVGRNSLRNNISVASRSNTNKSCKVIINLWVTLNFIVVKFP